MNKKFALSLGSAAIFFLIVALMGGCSADNGSGSVTESVIEIPSALTGSSSSTVSKNNSSSSDEDEDLSEEDDEEYAD